MLHHGDVGSDVREMVTAEWSDLLQFCERVLVAVGMDDDDATVVADALVAADLRGVDTHGVMRLPIYVRRLEMGLIDPRPVMKFARSGPGTGTLDGGNGPGQLVGMIAMDRAIDLATEAGIGAVAARNSNHFGTAAHFALRATERAMIGLAFTHAEADMVPYGGRSARLGTNPLAVAIPGAEPPIALDMATSAAAMGRVMLAAKRGETLPAGWAVDATGEPTTDPALVAAVLPMAGPKGSGLSVVIDILCALLTGSAFGLHINRMYDNFDEPQAIGHFFMAIDVARFTGLDAFSSGIAAMVSELKSTPPADDSRGVLLPGELEANTARDRRAHGIPLSEAVHGELVALGERHGVELRCSI